MANTIPLKKHDWEAAWLLFLAGATYEEISAKCNIPFNQVEVYGASHKWRMRREDARERAHLAVKRDLRQRIEQVRVKHQHFMLDQLDHTAGHIEQAEVKSNLPGEEEDDKKRLSISEKLNLLDRQDVIARRVLGMDEPGAQDDPIKSGFFLLVTSQPLVTESQPIDVEAQVSKTNVHGEEIMPTKIAFTPPKSVVNNPEKDASATTTLPDASDANTGIKRPFNGGINGSDTVPETGEAGPQAGKDDQLPPEPIQ